MNELNEIQDSLRYIPLFPLLGAVFNLLFGRSLLRSLGDQLGREIVHLVAIAAIAFSFFFTAQFVFGKLVGTGYDRIVDSVYPWIVSGSLNVGFDLVMDHLSSVMCLVITGVGLLIHIFSVGYMAKDPDYGRYFAYLNLFGEHGAALLNPLRLHREMHGSLVNVTPSVESSRNIYRQSYDNELTHFVDCVRSGKTPLSPGSEAVTVLKVLEAIYKSAQTGREVKLA